MSSKLPELESGDQLKRRIDEASRHVPLESLALSPQCGFASTMEGNLLTEDEQWRKLKLVVDTAKDVLGSSVDCEKLRPSNPAARFTKKGRNPTCCAPLISLERKNYQRSRALFLSPRFPPPLLLRLAIGLASFTTSVRPSS